MMNFNSEAEKLANALDQVSGYMACEKIIIRHILQHVEKGMTEPDVEIYLKKLCTHLEQLAETGNDSNALVNYRYVTGFVHTILRTTTWRKWIQTIETTLSPK
jgi:hypothetical protein